MKTYVLLLIVAASVLPSFAQNFRELDEHGYLLRDGFNRRPRAVQTRLTGFTAKKWTDWDRVNTEIAFSQAFALFRSPIEMSYAINTYGGVGNSETWRFKFELGFAIQVLRGANDEYGFAPRIAGTVKPSDSPTLYNLDVGNETISLILPVSVRWNEKLSTVFNAGLAYNEYKTWDWNYFFPDIHNRFEQVTGFGFTYHPLPHLATLLEATHTKVFADYVHWESPDRFYETDQYTLLSPGIRCAIPTGTPGQWMVGAGVPFSVDPDNDVAGFYFYLSFNGAGLQ